MLIVLLCAAIAVMAVWPKTSAGLFLRRWLVEAPARKLRPGVMIFGAILLLAVVGAVAWGKTEGLVVAAQGADAIGWFVAFDIGTYIDIIAVAWLLAATVRFHAAAKAAASAFAQARRFASARMIVLRNRAPRRPRRPGRRAPPPSDDGRGWAGLAFV